MVESTVGTSITAKVAHSSSSAADRPAVDSTTSDSEKLERALRRVCRAFSNETKALDGFTASRSKQCQRVQNDTLDRIADLLPLIERIPDRTSGESWEFPYHVKQYTWFRKLKMPWSEEVCSKVSNLYSAAGAVQYLTRDEIQSELKMIRRNSHPTGPTAKLLRETVKDAYKVAQRIRGTLRITHGVQVGDLRDISTWGSSVPLSDVNEATAALFTMATLAETPDLEIGESVECLTDEEMEEHVRRLRLLLIRYKAASSIGVTVENAGAA